LLQEKQLLSLEEKVLFALAIEIKSVTTLALLLSDSLGKLKKTSDWLYALINSMLHSFLSLL
jgi:hypothetical protein